jgi:hypothetical protein
MEFTQPDRAIHLDFLLPQGLVFSQVLVERAFLLVDHSDTKLIIIIIIKRENLWKIDLP